VTNNKKLLQMLHGSRGKIKKSRRLKASISLLHANSNELQDIRYFDAFTVGSFHLKKPSGGPKGLIGPPCHGAHWLPEAFLIY
jgi:hypothetical protein